MSPFVLFGRVLHRAWEPGSVVQWPTVGDLWANLLSQFVFIAARVYRSLCLTQFVFDAACVKIN